MHKRTSQKKIKTKTKKKTPHPSGSWSIFEIDFLSWRFAAFGLFLCLSDLGVPYAWICPTCTGSFPQASPSMASCQLCELLWFLQCVVYIGNSVPRRKFKSRTAGNCWGGQGCCPNNLELTICVLFLEMLSQYGNQHLFLQWQLMGDEGEAGRRCSWWRAQNEETKIWQNW